MEYSILAQLVALFLLATVVVLICNKLHVPSIVGFLLTGLLCGPSAFGLVKDIDVVDVLSEVGVALLLFTIGMELSRKELLRMKKPLLLGGSVQILLTIGIVFAVLFFFLGFSESIVFGCLISLSSTAICLSLLQQKAQMDSPQGRVCLAILIFQDLVIVPMMLIFPLLAGGLDMHFEQTVWVLGKAILVLAGIVLFGRFVLPRLMFSVVRSRSRELMLMTTLGLCLSIAQLTNYVGLSTTLGAFLAGLMLAESEYSLSVTENILPFKDVFTSIFFVSIGMMLDMNFFLHNIHWILLLTIGVILVKAAAVIPAVRAVGYSLRTAILSALSIAQSGEFSLVLAQTAVTLGLLSENGRQLFLAASILTMALTPLLMGYAPAIAGKLLRKHKELQQEQEEIGDEVHNLSDHIIIIGFGIGGKSLARVAKQSGIPYIISELNPDTVARYRDTEPIHHGDASYPLVLEHLGVATARVLAILVSDPAGNRAIITNARKINPALHIVVRSRFLGDVQTLRALGANDVIPEEFETSIEVFARVLNYYLIPRQSIENHITQIREENYGMLRRVAVPVMGLGDLRDTLPNMQVGAFTVESGSEVDGKPLSSGILRSKYQAIVVGIHRQDKNLTLLHADTITQAGDIVYVFAEQDAVRGAYAAFRAVQPDEQKPEV